MESFTDEQMEGMLSGADDPDRLGELRRDRVTLTPLIALALNGATAYGAYRKEAVSRSGAVAGFLVGTAIFVGSGVLGWVLLMWFFGSSTLIGKLMTTEKRRAVNRHEKGSRRDWVQVGANGGLPAIASIYFALSGDPLGLLAAAAALASATADTWASEIGALSSRAPRSIITFRRIPTGTSGGVTLLGTAASAGGSVSVALLFFVGALFSGATPQWDGVITASQGAAATLRIAAGVVALAGFFGSVVDSLLGATLQAQYRDDQGEVTERREGNRLVRGFAPVTNDLVNAVSGLLVTGVALALV